MGGITGSPEYDKLTTGSFTALSQTLDIGTANNTTISIQVTGTWVGTIVFEVSNDNSTFIQRDIVNSNNDFQSISITTNGMYIVNGAGYANLRIRSSTWSSGTATISVFGSDSELFRIGASESTINQLIPGTGTLIAASDGTNLVPLKVDSEGRLVTSALTGFGANFTFGDVTTSATTQVVIQRTAYTEQTTNAQRSILSGNANDTAAGTGARTVTITYYDQTGVGPLTEIVTLNGITAVNTTNTNICFIEKIQVTTVGSTGSNVGTLTLKAATAGGGATIGTISPTDNQTFWCHHYVATGKTCNITGISASHNGTTVGSGGVFILKQKLINVANTVELQVSDFVRLYGQSSTFSRVYQSPIKVTGPARLFIYLIPETASSVIYRSAIDFFEP